MLALVVALAVVVALLGVLVFGLLRSHADILRALHSLGAGVGDPAGGPSPAPAPVELRASGPPLPAERSAGVHDLEGTAPGGGAVAVTMSASPLTLVAFLSSGCTSCAALWASLADPAQLALLPGGTRLVVVTKGPEWESPAAIAAQAPEGATVVMSTAAWGDYEVPGSPYVVLVDGRRGRRAGEGVGRDLAEIADMVSRAAADDPGPAAGSQSRAAALGLNGAEREAHNDAVLREAGIHPGHPSLYPRSLDDVFAATATGDDAGEGDR